MGKTISGGKTARQDGGHAKKGVPGGQSAHRERTKHKALRVAELAKDDEEGGRIKVRGDRKTRILEHGWGKARCRGRPRQGLSSHALELILEKGKGPEKERIDVKKKKNTLQKGERLPNKKVQVL